MAAAAQRDELGRFAPVVEKGRDGIRGKDRKKFANWVNLVIHHTFNNGWFIADFREEADLKTLGRMGGGCSGDHMWTVQKNLEHIMALCDLDGVPKAVLHFIGLENAWLNIANDTQWKGVYNNLTYVGSLSDNYGRYRQNPEQKKKELRDNIGYYKQEMKRIQERYEALKIEALAFGPLGRDNPRKYDMDYLNQDKNAYIRDIDSMEKQLKEMEEEGKAAKPIETAGRRVIINERHFILIHGSSRYDKQISEWLDTLPDSKKVPLKHDALPEAEVFPTIEALREKVFACKDIRVQKRAW